MRSMTRHQATTHRPHGMNHPTNQAPLENQQPLAMKVRTKVGDQRDVIAELARPLLELVFILLKHNDSNLIQSSARADTFSNAPFI